MNMSALKAKQKKVVFATHAFADQRTGPAVFAKYLWEAFRDDPDIEFHLVAPDGSFDHPRFHRFSSSKSGSYGFYSSLLKASLAVCQIAGPPGILHLNASHYGLVGHLQDWRIWLQVNDYEGPELFCDVIRKLRSDGPRRLVSIMRRRYIERRQLGRCDLALANSNYTRRAVLDTYSEVPPAKVLTFYKAVDLDFFTGTRVPSTLGDGRRFVFLGRNFRIKQLHLVVEAFAGLSRGAGVLRVAGCTKGEFIAAHPSLADAASHPDIYFLGSLDRKAVRELLWASDTLLLPSRQEAFGVAALEAIASGCRVIGANVGGIPEIIGRFDVGYLVEQPTVALWRSAMITEIEKKPTIGEDRAALLSQFGTGTMISRLRHLYNG
jgi:glycosyltransferase involved in cell wall biosynthesis